MIQRSEEFSIILERKAYSCFDYWAVGLYLLTNVVSGRWYLPPA